MSQSRIQALPLPGKVLYTVFAVFTLAGVFDSLLLYDVIVDFGVKTTPHELYDRLIEHYHDAGGDPVAPSSRAVSAARPVDRETLLEVSHAHLFTMPVLLLIAGHLVLLTAIGTAGKLWLIGLGSFGMATHLLAPWLVRGFGRSLGFVYPISGVLLLVPLVLMLGIAVVSMWLPRQTA